MELIPDSRAPPGIRRGHPKARCRTPRALRKFAPLRLTRPTGTNSPRRRIGDFVTTLPTLPGHSIDAYLPGYNRDVRSATAGRAMSAARDETAH